MNNGNTFSSAAYSFKHIVLARALHNLRTAVLLACCTLSPAAIPAQPVVIKGFAPEYRGSVIAAYTYKDFITKAPLRLATEKVNDSGKFVITLTGIKETQYLYLNIDNLNGSIYVTPGNTYHIVFPTPDSTRYQNPYISHSIDLIFIIRDTDNVNNLIMDFNEEFYNFWKKNYAYFLRKQGEPRLDSFDLQMQKRYSQISNPYFKTYIKYTFAQYRLSILMGMKTLGNKYLKDQPILYHNNEYMDFFNDYFKGYLEQISAGREGDDLKNYINNNNYQGIVSILKINPLLLDNDSLCELVLLKGLYELYYSGDYKKDNIVTMLHHFAGQTKIDEDRKIATDMLHSFTGITDGDAAPGFSLRDANGNLTALSDFRGKYLYLGFIKSSSEQCLGELNVMAALNKTYGKKMYFVCIAEDQNMEEMKAYLKQNKSFTWKFLFDDSAVVRLKYDVDVIPEFFLIDPAGRFKLAPANEPGHGIELELELLMETKKK
ncbi:MAG: TlpA family protein disulfide reductase [Bacteroidia bacterium]|nr:TlpA family protein disulfide reductase [Bacteroidia bacterium]